MNILPFVTIPTTISAAKGKRCNFYSKHSGRAYANAVIRWGKRIGFLKKDAQCVMCSTTHRAMHWHHESYAKPEQVTPLCPRCHKNRHVALGWGTKGSGKAAPTLKISLEHLSDAEIEAFNAACIALGVTPEDQLTAIIREDGTPNPKPKKAA